MRLNFTLIEVPRASGHCAAEDSMSIVARLPRRSPALFQGEDAEPPAMLLRGRSPRSPEECTLSEQILTEFRADSRYSRFVLGCLNCGECTTGCPAARFYDFSPREMLQVAETGDATTLWDAMQEKIWACCQCYSCTMRCRFGNDIGGIISVMRELSVVHGLPSARRVLAPFGRTFTLLTTVGTQLSPDMIQPDFFRDWGPLVTRAEETWGVPLEVLRKAVPVDVLQTTRSAWEVSVQTSLELFRIYEETGVLDMLRGLDPDLTEMLVDIVDERREEFEEARKRFASELEGGTGPAATFPG
jgi:heterodisulfide reductase subunit C